MLELRAINLDAGARVPEHRLRHGFHHAGLSRAGRTEKEKIAYRTSRRIQTGQEHLVNLHHLLNCLVLADDLAAKCVVEILGVCAAPGRVEYCCKIRSHSL